MTIYKDGDSLIQPATDDDIRELNKIYVVNTDAKTTENKGPVKAFEYFSEVSKHAHNANNITNNNNEQSDNYSSNILNMNPDELIKNGVEKMTKEQVEKLTNDNNANNAERTFNKNEKDTKKTNGESNETTQENTDNTVTETIKSNKWSYALNLATGIAIGVGIVVGIGCIGAMFSDKVSD